VNFARLFFAMIGLGGAGGALGSIVGNAFGRGGLITGGVIGGVLFVIAGGFLADRQRWIAHDQRPWVIAGAVAGFGLACVVALSTLSSPVGPILSTLLIGTGAVLAALAARSPHGQS
jgi:hypothetical protein